MSHIKKVYVVTTESIDFISLNHDIAAAIKEAGAANGVVHVVVPKGGAGVLVFKNLPEIREALTPQIHVALLPRSFVCPFVDHELLLAPYEDVLLVDCDPRSQRREVIVAIVPETEASPE
jgi:thiamine phosphate synthase YjbQ (UPF0047 family)